MKINLYSPKYPPQRCGVGDYNYGLSETLIDMGCGVVVYTDPVYSAQKKGRAPVLSWNKKSTAEGIEKTLIHYTPYLYPRFFELLKIIKNHDDQVTIFFHELYFPPSVSLRGVLIGIPHFLKFLYLLHRSSGVLFSTANFCELWSRRLPCLKSKMNWISIGSTIRPIGISEDRSQKNRSEFVLLHFGGAHPTHLYDYIFHAFEKLGEIIGQKSVKLVLVGVRKEELKYQMNSNRVFYLGYLDEKEVSQRLYDADLVLAPFMDGVSTRRSTVISALAHGKPVITTLKSNPDSKAIPWTDGLIATSLECADPKQAYIDEVIKWSQKEFQENRLKMSEAAVVFYEKYFSWKVIGQKLLDVLK